MRKGCFTGDRKIVSFAPINYRNMFVGKSVQGVSGRGSMDSGTVDYRATKNVQGFRTPDL